MRVALDPTAPQRRWALLRPLNGEDELALDPQAPDMGNELLQRLLQPRSGAALQPAQLGTLTVAERDRLLAAVYSACYGDAVAARGRCAGCARDYEFGFSLAALLDHQDRARATARAEGPDAQGRYRLPDGTCFRLPTVNDLAALAGLDPAAAQAALVERCAGGAVPDLQALQSAMEALAPMLCLDVSAPCPHCGAAQSLPFDIERFLVEALAAERRYLRLEIHRLASAYRWPLSDILRISRSDRRALVSQVDHEHGLGSAW